MSICLLHRDPSYFWVNFQSCNLLKYKRCIKFVSILEANHSKNHGIPLFFPTYSHPLSLSDLLQNHMNIAMLLEHMHKKFEINPTKIKDGCQSGRKVLTHNAKSDLPLPYTFIFSQPTLIFCTLE